MYRSGPYAANPYTTNPYTTNPMALNFSIDHSPRGVITTSTYRGSSRSTQSPHIMPQGAVRDIREIKNNCPEKKIASLESTVSNLTETILCLQHDMARMQSQFTSTQSYRDQQEERLHTEVRILTERVQTIERLVKVQLSQKHAAC